MKVLITGSNGFIGSHVVRYFKEKGCYVIGLDRSEGSKNDVDEYIFCDLYTEQTSELFDGVAERDLPDAIIHLAADMRKEPYTLDVIKNNCVGAQRLLELCRDRKIKAFVQLSSQPVIGTPTACPVTEDHPLKPPTVYHCTKVMQELLANYAYYTYGVRTVSFRITAPVGPGMNPKTILPVFINKAIRGEDITLLGTGSRRQTYIHVNDIAKAIFCAICSKDAQGVYNLASHNLISNTELAALCIQLAKSSSKIVYSGTEDPHDDYRWEISLEKITRDTGYTPEVDIKDAICELIAFYSES